MKTNSYQKLKAKNAKLIQELCTIAKNPKSMEAQNIIFYYGFLMDKEMLLTFGTRNKL